MNTEEMLQIREILTNNKCEFPTKINGVQIITVEQMRQADAWTIENLTPSEELMFRAGVGLFCNLCKTPDCLSQMTQIPETKDAYSKYLNGDIRQLVNEWLTDKTLNKKPIAHFSHVAIIAGSGNNAGDGYVLATLLHAAGVKVTIIRLKDKCSADGQFYFDKCVELGIANKIYETGDLSTQNPHGFDCIVDCILGTGFKGEVRGDAADVIKLINIGKDANWFVLSCDINSGLNGDTGQSSLCIHSNLTVSVGYYKPGHFLGIAPNVIDNVTNVDIGISSNYITK